MPRFNSEGRSSKFVHMMPRDNNKFSGDDRNKFKFTLKKGGIQRNQRGPRMPFSTDTDAVMDNAEAGTSGRSVHFENARGGRGRGGRYNKQWRRNQGQGPPHQSNSSHSFGPSWHRVNIYNGKAYDKNFVLPALAQNCRLPFVPIFYATYGTNTAFYVEDRRTAEALAECSGKVVAPDGQNKINLKINHASPPPTAHIDEECEAKIKAALDRRFNVELNTLSLENFFMSPEIVNDYFLPLYRKSVVDKLAELLQPHLESIVGLDLSNNRLPALEGLAKLINKATSLKALNLKGNGIREMSSLDRISAPGLVELILEGNPVSANVEDREAFISSVQRRFPKVVKLDGLDIAPRRDFDIEEPTKMPSIKPSSFCNEGAKQVIAQFWELYVTIFDSEDREPLAQAYHDSAMMSMQACYTQPGHVSQVDSTKKLSYYLPDSRNMIRQTDKNKRLKLLHQGKLEILSFLSKFPKTTHDPSSYIVDMPVAVENFILFTVTGLYKERDERSTPFRYFSRTFTLVPLNGGFVIINEMLYITNPTTEQVKNAFRPLPAPAPVAVQPQPSSSGASVNPTVPVQLSVEQMNEMCKAFALQSGMNEDWSRKCLEQNAWDFNKSAQIFTQLKQENKIPPEAFVK